MAFLDYFSVLIGYVFVVYVCYLALDDASCRSDMLAIITAMKSNMTGARSGATAGGTNEDTTPATAGVVKDEAATATAGSSGDSVLAGASDTASTASFDAAGGTSGVAVAAQTLTVGTTTGASSDTAADAGDDGTPAERQVKRFRTEHPTLALVRTSDRHIQIDTDVFYCGCFVDVYVSSSNDRLLGALITVVTPTEVVFKARNGVRRSVFIHQLVHRRVVLSASGSV